MIKLQEISSFRDFLNFKDSWNSLLEKSDNNCIFLTWEWLKTWLETFQGDSKLLILLGYSNSNELVGIAPLIVRKRKIIGVNIRSIEYIGSGQEVTPDQLSFITLPQDKTDFIKKIFIYLGEIKTDWDIIRLGDAREDAQLLNNLKNLVGNNKYYINYNGVCPYIELPKTWAEYAGRLSSKFRYNFGRREKIFSKDFTVEFSVSVGTDSINEVMDKFHEIHKKRMLTKKTVGVSMMPCFWDFHRKISLEFLKRGWLFLGLLKANSEIVACQYSFQYNNKVYFYQVGMESEYSKYGLGSIVIANMIKESIRRGLGEYDFLRGNEPYKFYWAQDFRRNLEIIVWNKTLKCLVVSYIYGSKRLLTRLLKKIIRKKNED